MRKALKNKIFFLLSVMILISASIITAYGTEGNPSANPAEDTNTHWGKSLSDLGIIDCTTPSASGYYFTPLSDIASNSYWVCTANVDYQYIQDSYVWLPNKWNSRCRLVYGSLFKIGAGNKGLVVNFGSTNSNVYYQIHEFDANGKETVANFGHYEYPTRADGTPAPYTVQSNNTAYLLVYMKLKDGDTSAGSGMGVDAGEVSPLHVWNTNMRYATYVCIHPYTITLNKNGGSGGLDALYEAGSVGWYSDYSQTTKISAGSTILVPTKTGYTFTGYYTAASGGTQMIDANGKLISDIFDKKGQGISDTSTYNQYKTLYAQWTANTYSISYNLNGGTYGTYHPASAAYDAAFSVSNPTRTGYTFAGWTITGMDSVSHTYGSSTTTATTISSTTATSYKNLRSTSGTVTFTANWTDITPPNLSFTANPPSWTNGNVIVTAIASDAQTSISKVEILDSDGKLLTSTTTSAILQYTDETEGIETFTAKATDGAGNVTTKTVTTYIDRENSDVTITDGDENSDFFEHGDSVENKTIGWVNRDVDLTVSAKDAASGIASIVLYDHYGTIMKNVTSEELEYKFTTEGVNHYKIIVTDKAGNTKTINLTILIDKTPPDIQGETEIDDQSVIELKAIDIASGIYTFKLYNSDGEEVNDNYLKYDEDTHSIEYRAGFSYYEYYKAEATDKAGNITTVDIHTPYTFAIQLLVDNLRENTENFVLGQDAVCRVTTLGYVDTVEIEFQPVLQYKAKEEGYSLNRLIADGEAFNRMPAEVDYLEYNWKVPNTAEPSSSYGAYRIVATAWRNGYKKQSVVEINLITEDELSKEFAKMFRRSIVTSTWD